MDIKTIKVELEEEVARLIGDAVAKAIATDNADNEPTARAETAADKLDSEAMEEVMETEDFKAFYGEVTKRVNGLTDLILANKAKYNCSVVIGLTSLMGKVRNFGGTAFVGRGDSLSLSLKRILTEESIRCQSFRAFIEALAKS